MKNFILFLVLILTTGLFAQAPNKMSYQTVIRDNSNALITNQNVSIRISILQGSITGSAVYSETHSTTTNVNGLASIEIGGGTPSPVGAGFAIINWANGPFFIKTETDPSGGTNYNIVGTSQLLSVPYALYAAKAGSVPGTVNFTHYIGESFGGGIIFYLWKDAQGVEHGLIVDKVDLSTSQVWSNIDQTAVPAAQSLWNGLANSNGIVAQAGHTTSAALLCLNSTNSGQTDWYLPSIQELNMLWNNYFIVSKVISQTPGATQMENFYWSSSEPSSVPFYAWYLSFGFGDCGGVNKSTTRAVRAIRAF